MSDDRIELTLIKMEKLQRKQDKSIHNIEEMVVLMFNWMLRQDVYFGEFIREQEGTDE